MSLTEVEASQGASAPRQLEKPSHWPTILVSMFFGIFGLWPALRHKRMAEQRGYKGGSYIVAWAIPMLLLCALVLVVGFTIIERSAATYVIPPQTVAPGASQAAPSTSGQTSTQPVTSTTETSATVLSLVHESQADTPSAAATEVSDLFAAAYSQNVTETMAKSILAKIFFCRDNSCGYSQALAQLGVMKFDIPLKLANVSVNTATGLSPGEFSANTTIYVDGGRVTLTLQAAWYQTRWAVGSIHWQVIPA